MGGGVDLAQQLALFVASLLANALSAFAGGGAGLVQLPVLIFLGLPFGVALATHKIASVALGLGATLRHIRSGRLERLFLLLMLCSGVPGVLLGASVILQVPDQMARLALGVVTLAMAVYSWRRPQLGQDYAPKHVDRRGLLWGGVVLFLIGVLNGSLTSGTGLLATLWLVRWFGLDYQRAVAYTLVAVGIAWNGTGALVLGILGEVRWSWLPALLLGSLFGGYLGAHLSIVKGNKWIKRLFESVCVVIGVKLVWGAI
jgi:uncharacterized protein